MNKNKKVGIYGLGKSGLSLCFFLQKSGYDFVAWDDYKNTNTKFQNHIVDIKNWVFEDISTIVISPGIDIAESFVAQKAKEYNIEIIADIALFYDLFKPSIIGITGTNGKSTAVSMLAYIFENLQIPCKLGGNIGIPVFDLDMEQKNVYILELSSYQLSFMGDTKIEIGAILNIAPDHLDHHKNFENYLDAKLNIFKNQKSENFAIVNYDDKKLLKALLARELEATKIFFSVKEKLQDGYFLNKMEVFFAQNGVAKSIVSLPQSLFNLGQHNIENILVVLIICHIKGLDLQKSAKVLETFKNLEHRQEVVKKIDNVTFVNDSKATNPPATVRALENFENIYLILGGIAKTDNLDDIYSKLANVKKVYLIGQSKDLFFDLLSGKTNVQKCLDLENAIKKAFIDAKASAENAVVLFSPACSSFDEFQNFEHRGQRFKEYVLKLENND